MSVPAMNRSSGGGASQPVANSAPVRGGVGTVPDQITSAAQPEQNQQPQQPQQSPGFFERMVQGGCGFLGKMFTPVYNLAARILRPFWNCLVNLKNGIVRLFSDPNPQPPPSSPPPQPEQGSPQQQQPAQGPRPAPQPEPLPQPPPVENSAAPVEERRDLFEGLKIDPKKLLENLRDGFMPTNPAILYPIFEYLVDCIERKDSVYLQLGTPLPRGQWFNSESFEERGRNYAKRNPSVLIPHLIEPLDEYVKTHCRS